MTVFKDSQERAMAWLLGIAFVVLILLAMQGQPPQPVYIPGGR